MASKKAKAITATISVVGGDNFEVKLKPGTKISKALASALKDEGFDVANCDVRLNNREFEGDPTLRQDDLVTVTPKIKGGR